MDIYFFEWIKVSPHQVKQSNAGHRKATGLILQQIGERRISRPKTTNTSLARQVAGFI